MKKQAFKSTVKVEEQTVEYWRKRFAAVVGRFKNFVEIADTLAEVDPENFAGYAGYKRLENVKRNKGGIGITSTAVKFLEEIRPETKRPTSLLSRQKIVPTR